MTERIRIALLGFSYWGPNYAPVLSQLLGVRVTFICDSNADLEEGSGCHDIGYSGRDNNRQFEQEHGEPVLAARRAECWWPGARDHPADCSIAARHIGFRRNEARRRHAPA